MLVENGFYVISAARETCARSRGRGSCSCYCGCGFGVVFFLQLDDSARVQVVAMVMVIVEYVDDIRVFLLEAMNEIVHVGKGAR